MKKKKDFNKRLLTGLFIFTFIFIALNMYTFMKTGVEQIALISAVFTFLTAEVVNMTTIKNTKTKYGSREEKNDDES